MVSSTEGNFVRGLELKGSIRVVGDNQLDASVQCTVSSLFPVDIGRGFHPTHSTFDRHFSVLTDWLVKAIYRHILQPN